MTSLFTHPPCAEDQPNAHAILYLHVIRASAMSCAFLSLPISLIFSQPPRRPLLAMTLLYSGRGLIIGSLAGAAMTWKHMRGREEVEWQDRSWRLLENSGEVDTDWESIAAAGGGAAAGVLAARRGILPLKIGQAALGGAGVGLSSGVLFMIATYVAGRKPA